MLLLAAVNFRNGVIDGRLSFSASGQARVTGGGGETAHALCNPLAFFNPRRCFYFRRVAIKRYSRGDTESLLQSFGR